MPKHQDNLKVQTIEDIDYIKSVAESAVQSPLLGGSCGLMWSLLTVVALSIHGLIETGLLSNSYQYIFPLWISYGLIGTILTLIIVRREKPRAGFGSIGNQVERTLWPTSSNLIVLLFISIVVGTKFMSLPTLLFNMIVPFALALYAINYLILYRLTGAHYLKWAGWGSALFMVLTILWANNPYVYFLAVLGIIFCGFIPSWIELRGEQKNG